MPSSQTSNYKLNQWSVSDKVLRTDFNADNAKIDAALKAESDARKAEADARTAAVTALNAAVAKRGNCQVASTSYVGHGSYGKEYPNTLTFPEAPALALVFGDGDIGILVGGVPHWRVIRESAVSSGYATWSNGGKTVSWYSGHQHNQLSTANVTYQVMYFYVL